MGCSRLFHFSYQEDMHPASHRKSVHPNVTIKIDQTCQQALT